MTRVAALLILALTLQAHTLPELIAHALEKNPSLEAIAQRIDAMDAQLALAGSFTNPQLAIGINDIQSADPLRRDMEPMQTSAVTLTQKVPFFGKREAREAQAKASKASLEARLREARVQLVGAIKTEAYLLWEHQTLYAILCRYEELARRSIALHQTYTATSGKSSHHMGIMSAELTLSELTIQKSQHLRAIQNGYARLGYLVNMPVDSLEIELQMNNFQSSSAYEKLRDHNHALRAKAKEVDAAKALLRENELLIYPDPTIQAGYFYRESFEDYFSLGISAELPLYGREKRLEERERRNLLAKEAEADDLSNSIAAQISMEYEKMKEAYTTYRVITEQSMPKIEHMLDLAGSSVQSGGDLFTTIDMLEKRLRLDTQRIQSLRAYHTAEATLEALTGGSL